MRTLNVLFLGLALPIVGLAGCIDDGNVLDEAGSAIADTPATAFQAQVSGCREGGGVSMYNANEGDFLIEPYYEYADIEDDMGYPAILSYGTPNLPDQIAQGIHHITVVCDKYVYNGEERTNLEWGWVGQRVKAPPWDTSGIERQYFIADFDFSDTQMVEDLNRVSGLHVSTMLNGVLEWPAPNLLHQILGDDKHGEFETYELMKDYRSLDERQTVMRFWFHVAVGDMHGHEEGGEPGLPGVPEGAGADTPMYKPVAIDIIDTYHPENTWMVIDNVRVLMHVFGVEEGEPGSHQGIFGGALYYEGYDREIRLADVEAPLVDASWFH